MLVPFTLPHSRAGSSAKALVADMPSADTSSTQMQSKCDNVGFYFYFGYVNLTGIAHPSTSNGLGFSLILKTFPLCRAIQKNFIDMENMFDLMRVDSDVKDAIGAPDLHIHRGGVEFKHVSFGYGPERLVLNNISFKIAPGSTVALVSLYLVHSLLS